MKVFSLGKESIKLDNLISNKTIGNLNCLFSLFIYLNKDNVTSLLEKYCITFERSELPDSQYKEGISYSNKLHDNILIKKLCCLIRTIYSVSRLLPCYHMIRNNKELHFDYKFYCDINSDMNYINKEYKKLGFIMRNDIINLKLDINYLPIFYIKQIQYNNFPLNYFTFSQFLKFPSYSNFEVIIFSQELEIQQQIKRANHQSFSYKFNSNIKETDSLTNLVSNEPVCLKQIPIKTAKSELEFDQSQYEGLKINKIVDDKQQISIENNIIDKYNLDEKYDISGQRYIL